MHRLLALIFTLSLVGCATGPVVLPIDNLASSAKTPVEDLRPKTEATREFFSMMITSDRYGYMRLPQDITEPNGARLFAHRLQEKYGTNVAPPTKLHHFVVYLNNRAELKKVALGAAFGGAIGAGIMGSSVKREGDTVHTLVDAGIFSAQSGEDEYKRAIYADSEIPAGTSAYVIYIEGEHQGQRRFTRTVWPIKPSAAGQNIPLHLAMDSAIKFNLNP